ncbi:MAG: tyrosine-type recombinase/integrase [Solirubrobacteraceae bacterium]
MSAVAPTLQAFFTDRLLRQRLASPRTVTAYRDSLRLLVTWVHDTKKIPPHRLDWTDLDAATITGFLDHLEHDRQNTARTRNLRLTAIRSLFAYASLQHPEHAESIRRVLAIPPKRFDRPEIRFLTQPQLAVLLAAPDLARWEGRRDQALIALCAQTGLRVAELTGLNNGDVTLESGANVRCLGKGRKHRSVPLNTATSSLLGTWVTERGGRGDEPLFPTRTGRRLSPDAVERIVAKHARTAAGRDHTFPAEKIHPHVLRHTCAMNLLQNGVDSAVIALWLGHADIRSTAAYLHADMTIKERALQRMTTVDTPSGRYRPSDKLLVFLDSL